LAGYLPPGWREIIVNSDPAVTTYVISEPFERALKAIREILARNDVTVAGELDVAARVKRELNIGFTPCRILLVDSPYLLLEAATFDCAGAVLFPLHLVVSGRGTQTQVHTIHQAALADLRLPAGASAPLAKLQALVSRSLERIAMRRDIYQPVLSHTR
jgi:uncharacterized protein (DUF302 family)